MTRLIGTVKGASLKGWEGKTEWDTALDTEVLFSEYERILRRKGTVILFSQEPYTFQLRCKQTNNFQFIQSAIWRKNHFANNLCCNNAMVSYFEDISVFTKVYSSAENPIKEYFKLLEKFIGLGKSGIHKALGHTRADHVFRTSNTGMQFSLCTETVYQELIEKFDIDEFQGFIPYADLKEMNRKFERTFNLPENEKYVSNVFEFPKEGKRYHPTQKPVLLLERLIGIYSNKGDTVLDNCMGSRKYRCSLHEHW